METAILWLLILVGLVIGIFVLRIPIIIAKNRELSTGDVRMIALLSWAGLFFGITWLAALVWAIFGTRIGQMTAPRPADSLEALQKLAQLRDQGLLTEAEYAQKRQSILDRI